ncbi:UDP-N-acetylmuramoyl-L-alanine--D-glutamate ligase [Guggenheimella bovis]
MKQYLIIGFGKTGKALYEYLKSEEECILHVYDDNPIEGVELFKEGTPYDAAFVSPGVSVLHPMFQYCTEHSIPVIGETELAYGKLRGDIIGITGTNGKTTTTTLIYEMIKKEHERTFLAGNIGFPILSYVKNSKDGDFYITELSSFQLETTEHFSVRLGVLTNLTPDHMKWHGGYEPYVDSKMKLWKNVEDKKNIVINYDDPGIYEAFEKRGLLLSDFTRFSTFEKDVECFVKNGMILFKGEAILRTDEILIPGNHNLQNALAAICISKLLGIKNETIREVLTTFKGIDHRYQIIGEKNGIRFINDSKATNPDSTMPAIKSAKRPTVLIAGGMDKGSDFKPLIKAFPESIKKLILFGETKEEIRRQALSVGYDAIEIVNNLDEAFQRATEIAGEGWDILLSPASASWDMYPSYEVRGEHFVRLFKEYHV